MSQRFWAIYGTHGFYTGTWITRAEAIKDHCEAKGWDWRTCYRRGDRCVWTGRTHMSDKPTREQLADDDAVWDALTERIANPPRAAVEPTRETPPSDAECRQWRLEATHVESGFAARIVALCDEVSALRAQLAEASRDRTPIARPASEWHEDLGPVLWWYFDPHGHIVEPPHCGTPLDDDFPEYQTHFTKVSIPKIAPPLASSPRGAHPE